MKNQKFSWMKISAIPPTFCGEGIYAQTIQKNNFPRKGERFSMPLVGEGVVVKNNRSIVYGCCPGVGQHFDFIGKLDAAEMLLESFVFQFYDDGIVVVKSEHICSDFQWHGVQYTQIVSSTFSSDSRPQAVYQPAGQQKLTELDFEYKDQLEGFVRI